MKKVLSILFLAVLVIPILGVELLAKDRNVILVLDSSYSMAGSGGKDIIDQVKESISSYIDGLSNSDNVTFVTFDERVKVYPTVKIEDKNDKDILKKFIKMTTTRGKWTNTAMMIEEVRRRAAELERENRDSQVVIVVMTDGIDDPSPGSARRANIKNIADHYEGKDWWVYIVDYAGLKKGKGDQENAGSQGAVGDGSTATAKGNVRVIDASEEPLKGLEKVEAAVDSRGVSSSEIAGAGIIAAIIIILIILIVLIRRFSQLKAHGRIEYWNNEILNPVVEHFDINRFNSRVIVIGKGAGCHLNIREFASRASFALRAVRGAKGGISLSLLVPEGIKVEFKNSEDKGFIEDGDVFKVKNYTFKYFAS